MDTLRNRIFEKAGRARIPVMGAFELLPVCNLQCKMCYVRKSMDEVQRLGGLRDARWWLDMARDAAACGLLFPLLTGGEPFLHPDFAEIYSGMLDLGLQVTLNSNGTLIDRNWAYFLGKHRPTRINITLYGASEESYRDLCGNADAYHRVLEAVALLKEYKVPVKFNASITPHNVKDLEAMIRFAKSQNAPIQVATYMFPPVRRDETMIGQNDRLSPEDAGLARVTADYLQSSPDWFLAQAARYRQFVPLERCPWEQETKKEMGIRCRAGLSSVWVDWQGNIANCGMYTSIKTNLEGKSFQEAWNEITEKTVKLRYRPDCASCSNVHLCRPCIAMIHNECGRDYGRPEYMCRTNQAMAHYYDQFAKEHYPSRTSETIIIQKSMDICEL